MSIDSSLIVRRAELPSIEALRAALAETGVTVSFAPDFALDQNVGGWTPMTVDGAPSGFDYGVYPLTELPRRLADEAETWGDTMLSFGARGALSAETVTLIQMVLGRRWRAALLIEDELAPPEDDWGRDASLGDLHVDVYGSPAKRASDLEAYVAQHVPPSPARSKGSGGAGLFWGVALLAIVGGALWMAMR